MKISKKIMQDQGSFYSHKNEIQQNKSTNFIPRFHAEVKVSGAQFHHWPTHKSALLIG